jgi:hypothetical protein
LRSGIGLETALHLAGLGRCCRVKSKLEHWGRITLTKARAFLRVWKDAIHPVAVNGDCDFNILRVVKRDRITGDAKKIERQPGREPWSLTSISYY